MNKPKIVLKNDGIYMENQINEHIFEVVPIITKEVFIEAFIKWIKCEEQEHAAVPQRGHWVSEHYDDYGHDYIREKCSICGQVGSYNYNYCPYCGARMKEQEHESGNTNTRL